MTSASPTIGLSALKTHPESFRICEKGLGLSLHT